MNNALAAAITAATLAVAGTAQAATLTLDGFTSSLQTVNVSSSPVPNTSSTVSASGFEITDTTSTETFVAWCLDISHYLMSPGSSQNYVVTTDPYSNSFGLSATAQARVQSVFDANYAFIDFTNGDQAAAFQMALWEAAYEDDDAMMSMLDGAFQATSNGSTVLAQLFLNNASSYLGSEQWDLTFLEVEGYGPDRAKNTGQNLVTVAAVPLPAAGALLLTSLLGAAAATRRRRARA